MQGKMIGPSITAQVTKIPTTLMYSAVHYFKNKCKKKTFYKVLLVFSVSWKPGVSLPSLAWR